MKKNLSYDLLKRVSLSDILGFIYPKRYISKRGKGKCPFHEDKHPSFVFRTVDEIDRWKCYAGCGEGDAVHFVIKSGTTKTIRETVSWLLENELLDSELLPSEDEKNYLISSIERQREVQSLYRKFIKLTKDSFLDQTPEAQKARDWFHSRGIGDIETLTSKFDVGYFNSERIKHLGLTTKELRDLGFFNKDKTLKMDDAICFMYQKTFGEYSGFKLRPVKTNKFKFFSHKLSNSKGDMGFFGLTAFEGINLQNTQNNDLILVEGEFDVIVPQFKALHMYGGVFSIVCRSGGAATSPRAFQNLIQHGISNLAIFPDNDKAGKEFLERCSRGAAVHNISVEVIWPDEYNLRPNLDPAELFISSDANEIKNILSTFRKPISSYLASLAKKKYDSLSKKVKDASNLRIKSIHLFVDIANSFGLSDLMRDEYAAELETLIADPLIQYNRIRKELERRTSKGSNIKIGGVEYSVGEDGYMNWVPRGENDSGFYNRISNFIVKYSRIVKFSNKDEYEIIGNILVNGKRRGDSFIISSRDLVTPEHFNTLIRIKNPVGIRGLHQLRTILPELVSRSNEDVPMFIGIDRVGYVEGTRTYVTPSTIIEEGDFTKNTEYNVAKSDRTISTFFKSIDFDKDEIESCSLIECRDLILNSFLDCLPRRNTLITLGHVFSSVLTPYYAQRLPPHALFFRGLAGSFKSTFAQITMGLFYENPFSIKWPTARSTPYSIEMSLSYVDNAPLLLDDIKSERQSAEEVMMIIQSLYDEQGRSRLNRDLTVREGRAVANQGLIVTGEIIPTNQLSILSRMIQLEFKRSEADLNKFDYLKDNLHLLRRCAPYFIKWLQGKYKNSTLEMYDFKTKDVAESNLERSFHQLKKMLTGLQQFLMFLVEETGLEQEKMEALMLEADGYSKKLLVTNISKITSVSKENMLLDDIGSLIQARFFSVYGEQDGAICVGKTDPKGDVIINLRKLRLGLTKHNIRTNLNQIDQMMADLTYQGKGKFVGKDLVWFPKDLILETDSSEKQDDDSNTLRVPSTPGSKGPKGG